MEKKKAEEETEVKEEKKSEDRYTVVQVPTEHTLAYADSKNEDVIDMHQAVAKLLNNQEKLMKALL